jgi:hypothetical protein
VEEFTLVMVSPAGPETFVQVPVPVVAVFPAKVTEVVAVDLLSN